MLTELRAKMEEMLRYRPAFSQGFELAARSITNPGLLSDFIAAQLFVRFEDKQAVLEEYDPMRRGERTLLLMETELDLLQTELEIQEVLEDFPGTTLLVTHSREEVHRLCRTVTVLDPGAGEGSMPVQTLFHAPETLSACLLSGCKNYSRAERLDEKHIRALDWGVTLACGARPDTRYVAIRAHHIALSDTPGENTIPCGVLRVVDDVFSTIVMASTPGGDTAQSRLRVELPKEAWSDRETLYLHLAPEHLMTLK